MDEFFDGATAEAVDEWFGAERRPVVRVEFTDTATGSTRESLLSLDAAADLRDALANAEAVSA